jgi:hypothetical protein
MHYIREYFITDPSICDEVFDACKKLKSNGYGSPGVVHATFLDTVTNKIVIDDSSLNQVKDSWDIMPMDFAEMYPKGPSELRLDELADELNEAIFPKYYNDISLTFTGDLFLTKPPHFQLYEPGGGYKVWHCDANGQKIHRMFVFILYLNDVPDGGTEFRDWNYTCKAEKGKVLMFPSNFCFVHRSQISHTSEKAIMTGWIDTDLVAMLRGER